MRKRILVFTLVIFLFSFSVSTSYVEAESGLGVLVGSVLATNPELAILVGIGVLGVTGIAVVYDNRDSISEFANNVRNDFVNFCSKSEEWASVTSAEIQYWLEGVATGVIDKADSVWLALKDFVVEQYKTQKNSETIITDANVKPIATVTNFSEWFLSSRASGFFDNVCTDSYEKVSFGDAGVDAIDAPYFGRYKTKLEDGTEIYENATVLKRRNASIYAIRKYYSDSSDTPILFRLCDVPNNLEESWQFLPSSYLDVPVCFSSLGNTWNGSSSMYSVEKDDKFFVGTSIGISPSDVREDGFYNDFSVIDVNWTGVSLNSYASRMYVENALVYVVNCVKQKIHVPGLDVEYDDGLSEEDTQSYVIDGSMQDVIERDGTLDNVDVVNPADTKSETVPLDLDGITIDDIAQPFPDDTVKTIDKATDTVLPDKTPVSDLPNDKEVSEFTIANLQKVFPFCIPWDLFKLYSTLLADAEAPKFVWKFPIVNTSGKLTYKELEIDLKDFDGVAKIVRTMELLAFMIFLTLKTRDLIRG